MMVAASPPKKETNPASLRSAAPSKGEAAEKVSFPCIAIIFMQSSDVSIGLRDLSKSHFLHKN